MSTVYRIEIDIRISNRTRTKVIGALALDLTELILVADQNRAVLANLNASWQLQYESWACAVIP